MECPFCGTNHNAHNCPNCGAPAPQPPVQPAQPAQPKAQPSPQKSPTAPAPRRKKRSPLLFFGLAIFVFLFLSLLSNVNNRRAAPSSQVSPAVSSSSAPAELPRQGTTAYQTLPEEEYKQQTVPFGYTAVTRAPGSFSGQDMSLTIKIIQTVEKDGDTFYLGYLRGDDGSWPIPKQDEARAKTDRCLFLDLRGPTAPNLFENDIVVLYGEFEKMREYSGGGGKQALPVFYGRYTDLVTDFSARFPYGSEAYNTLPEAEYIAQATPLDIEQIKRYPAQHKGQDYAVTLKITQELTWEGTLAYIGVPPRADGTFPTALDDDWADSRCTVVMAQPEPPSFYEDDVVTFYGDFSHIQKFEGLISNFSFPLFYARYSVAG